MREYTKKPENQSRTLDSNPRASRQAPISEILQAYKNSTLGRQPVQRESVEDEDLLQTKISEQTPVSVILQRYKESMQRNAPKEDEELLQGKFDTAQREKIEEDELLQAKFESASTIEKESIQREENPNNTGLPDNLKLGVENLSGYSLDDVKVHYNSDKPAQLSALAYTHGTDIHVGPGQEKHLPHEAWHVIQQKQGRVQPTIQLQDVNVNDNECLEKEADVMGIKAMTQIHSYKDNLISKNNVQKPVQLTPTVWVGSPDILRILNLPHGWFSTWKKIKARIREYNSLADAALDQRRSKLNEIRPLIVEWEANPRHTAASTEPRIQNIRAELPILKHYIQHDYTEIAVAADNITGGHAEVRHGADLTDQQLQDRITTGQDRTGTAAATDTRSRFASHDLLVSTKNMAINILNDAKNNTLAHFLGSLTNFIQAWIDFENTPPGPPKGAAGIRRNTARTANHTLAGNIPLLSPNLLRVNVNNPPYAGALIANIPNMALDMIDVRNRYKIVINHGRDLGPSFRGTGPNGGPHPGTMPAPSPQSTLTITQPGAGHLHTVARAANWPIITH